MTSSEKRFTEVALQRCSQVFLGVLKICRKLTVEHLCRSLISINLICNFLEITLRHGCSLVNLLYIFRIPFPKNTCGWLLLGLVLRIIFQRLLQDPVKHICDVLRDLKVLLKACNFTKSNTVPWVFCTFFKLYRFYQIAQNTTCDRNS